MSNTIEKQNDGLLTAPIEFRKALMVTRNAVLLIREDEYFECYLKIPKGDNALPRYGTFRSSFDLVDDYLTQVELGGWLDD